MRWYFEVLKKYAVFKGRARRKEFWMFFLINIIFLCVIAFVFGFIGALLGKGDDFYETAFTIYYLAVLIPYIAVGVRRMHDTGRNGAWLLFPLVNFVLLCYDSQPGDNTYGAYPK